LSWLWAGGGGGGGGGAGGGGGVDGSGGGGRSTPATLRLESWDALTRTKLTHVTYRIYSHFSSEGWKGCVGNACGNLVSTLNSAVSGDIALVPGGTHMCM